VGSRFEEFINGLWDSITPSYTFEANTQCGTHVHTSPSTDFTTDKVKAVARAALHFEEAINALVPEHRRGNYFCKTFLASNPNFQGKTVEEAIALVDQKQDLEGVCGLMNPNNDRYYTWNFTSLTKHSTIEFRQPPGVTTAAAALGWVEFTATFVRAAFAVAGLDGDLGGPGGGPSGGAGSDGGLGGFGKDVGGLKKFLEKGLLRGVRSKSGEDIVKGVNSKVKDSDRVPGKAPQKLDEKAKKAFEEKKKQDKLGIVFLNKMEMAIKCNFKGV